MKEVFILGSKGIPARYGGFETFVERLTRDKKSNLIQYHVACIAKESGDYQYNRACCFNIKLPEIGSARAVVADIVSLRRSIRYIEKKGIQNAIIYVLACRIGPFVFLYKRKMKKLGIKFFVNPDGHEWKRSKWNKWIRAYWKYSEKLMVKHADLLICDSRSIEEYIRSDYSVYRPQTTYISYGADIKPSQLCDEDKVLTDWYDKFNLAKGRYYLIVGRFVPENNYDLIIREFMKSDSKRDLVLITNKEESSYFNDLRERTGFEKDLRIKFVGTVYNEELLKKIRENAFAYFHGHEVGGTNPSLLEALACTKLNILLDVCFNSEVAVDSAMYFNKEDGNLCDMITRAEKLDQERLDEYNYKAKQRISEMFSWNKIVSKYEELFLAN